MKKIIIILIFTLLAANAYAGSGNINFTLGQKQLNEDDWKPLENQAELGVRFDYQEEGWPVSIAIDYLFSAKEDTSYLRDSQTGDPVKADVTGSTTELGIGVRKVWEIDGSSIRPFVGGGFALISAEVEAKAPGYITISNDDSGVGTWLNGGVYWTLNEHLNLGLELRYSQAEVTLNNYDMEAGGFHNGFFIGYHW